MLLVKQGTRFEIATWWRTSVSVYMSCPICKTIACLDDHNIQIDGTVIPSVQCPNCDFHEEVVLDNWRI